ncbi:hypothetical protein [Novosphingobium guangzhouense]|uniref:Uncharacterized protein n=1 Tax=Novosphingobium guangzhouense TaxID=1850347 RepID=A0A2K2G5Y9_9SPHN|nr:hypothetical protein [Novosphingobium guangzhouense]PNU06450.1 hypothetical protein A8V01_02585 [Novosphingobium guangzhouense]
MVPVIITAHAVTRYVERIGGTEDAAVSALSSATIRTAASFGARVVRLPTARVLMRFCEVAAFVVSVVPLTHFPQQLIPHAWGGPPHSRIDLDSFLNTMETAHG